MLDDILAGVRRRLPMLQALEGELRAAAQRMPPARDFQAALAAPGLSVIAEFKRASPSRGEFGADLDPAERAGEYAAGGAAALSVLTEPDFFLGSGEDLERARAAADLPTLRKDFILHRAQVWETRAMGADALLLIAALLEDDLLRLLLKAARTAGLAALVEVHDREEAARALRAGAKIVGVNNRDLRTFQVDLAVSERLAPLLEEAEATVAESGVRGPGDAARLAAAGYDGLLVGEFLTRSPDPAAALRDLRGAASGGRP